MATLLSGPTRAPGVTKVDSGPKRASSRSSQKQWRGSLPGLTPRLTPAERFEDFHEDFPAVTFEMLERLFNEGGILIFLPTPEGDSESPAAKVKLCSTPEEAKEFVKGYKAVDGAWFVWGDLFL